MHLQEARLCLDCEELHTDDTCPRCASDAFAFVTRWIPANERRVRTRRPPSAAPMPPVTAQNVPRAYIHRISREFFSTLRIPIVHGRSFTQAESVPGSPVVIVSERVTKRFWAGQDPIGKRIKFGPVQSDEPWLSIVGVVGEVKYRGLPDNPTADPDIYLPFADRSLQVGLVVRSSVPPASIAAPVRAAIRGLDPSIPIYSVASLESLVAGQTSQSRFTMDRRRDVCRVPQPAGPSGRAVPAHGHRADLPQARQDFVRGLPDPRTRPPGVPAGRNGSIAPRRVPRLRSRALRMARTALRIRARKAADRHTCRVVRGARANRGRSAWHGNSAVMAHR